MNFTELYLTNLHSVKSSLKSLWCSEAFTDKQKGYAEQLKDLIDNEIFASEDYEPLVQSMEYYESATDEETKDIFHKIDPDLWKKCLPRDKKYNPYKHQVKAWESLTADDCRSMVVTTGTGSGKTECFMIPLVNELLKNTPDNNDGFHHVKAIFLYPLNALMEDQKGRLQKLLSNTGNKKLTFAVYNGNLPDSENGENNNEINREKNDYPNIVATRQDLHRNGADIILTNPTMLEYMLIRDKDQCLFEANSLRWIIVDEVHTFTGAAATELAMLLRRLLNAFGTDRDQLHFAASSATMGNSDNKIKQENDLKQFISDISDISKDKVDVIPGKRNKFTPSADDEFNQCKKVLTEVDSDYIKLSELLPGYPNTEERLKKLDEFCDHGLRAKVHYFYRVANSGIRVQLDNWADKDKGLLKLQSIMPLDPNATPSLELVKCEHCGEYIAIGEINVNDDKHYRAATNTNEDLFDLNAEKTNRVFFGVVPATDPRKENNAYVTIDGNSYQTCQNPTGNWVIVANKNRQCPHCSASLYPEKKKETDASQNQEDPVDDTKFRATRLRISSEFIARLMAPGLLSNMKESQTVNAPHKGQQYISFVDSRQAAAKGTFNQNVVVERDWVFSRIFHRLLKLSSEMEITRKKQDLNTRLETASNKEDWNNFGQLSAELAKLNSQYPNVAEKDYLTWSDIYKDVLKNDKFTDNLCRQFVNQTNEEYENEEINPVVKDRYIFAVMLSNLAKYPPFQASAETMGLFMSYYPKLDRLTELPQEVEEFNAKFNTNIDLIEWKNLLKIYLDRTPRSNESIYMKMNNHLDCDIFNCSERFGLQRPPHRTVRKPILNDKCNNISLVPLLLAKLIDPQNGKLQDVITANRDDINSVIEAMWRNLIDLELLQYSEKIKDSKRKSTRVDGIDANDWEYDKDTDNDIENIPRALQNPDGRQLRLNVADIAFKLPEKVYYCNIAERGGFKTHIRPTYTTFCGYSPYPKANKIEKAILEKDWNNNYEFIYGEDNNHHKATLQAIENWLRVNRNEMYEYGLLGEDGCFNSRVLSVYSYPEPFIQAEHTAQVEKSLSRKTQNMFKDHKLNILACSTTMEMGVDLGDLELVIMASIPPHPANYKQRAGRSGRNDSPRSACITLCSSDAVGHRVLLNPMDTIIRRQVEMPFVDWDSPTIIQRHINAFLYRQSKIFFSDDNARSSLNWSLIDIFSHYHFNKIERNKNGRNYKFKDIWDLRDSSEAHIYPKDKNPLGDSKGTRFELFAEWLKNNADPLDVKFLLKDTSYTNCAVDFIDRCSEEWRKRYDEIERELSYYGKQYEKAYQEAKNRNNPNAKANGELDTANGRRLLIQFNSILNRRLIDYLATHRFTPNANMPVDVVEFDIYHNRKDLYKGKRILSNPSYSLQQSLSQYAPGNMVVKENRVIKVAGVEYYNKDTDADRTIFYTNGDDVVGADSSRTISPGDRKDWPVNYRKELELIQVKSFIPDINAQDSRILNPSPYTTVNAYLVGAEDWNPSGHHLMAARCNLDAGEAKILYYNDGIGFGYSMCPKCGKMVVETGPATKGTLKGISSEMISVNLPNLPACHYAIDSVEDNGKPKICIPNRNKYYRNVIIGGLIQTDFCEMHIMKQNGIEANKETDKALLTTLGLVICQAFTEYIGKDRNSVDFSIMMNGNLCIFDTNPGGSGYSNKLSENQIRLEVIKRAKDMLDSMESKEEILDKFTVRYLNDIDIEATKEWLTAEINTWDNLPPIVKNSPYNSAVWANIIDILNDFKNNPTNGVLFCNDEFEQWNYKTSDISEVTQTWEKRIEKIIRDHSIGTNKVALLIPTNKTVPTNALSLLPQNGWVNIYTTTQCMSNNFYPLACVNGNLYFTDDKNIASMNGEWAKGDVFRISADSIDFSQKTPVEFNKASAKVIYLNNDDTKKCDSNKLAEMVLKLAEENGIDIKSFFKECENSPNNVEITYMDEHLKSVLGMITTMQFIDTLLVRMNRKDRFHIKFINEKYYTDSYEVNKPWLNIEKWERRNQYLKTIANHWIMTKYNKSEDEAAEIYENDTRNEKELPHWREITIECGNKKMRIYPHGGIINDWQIDRTKHYSWSMDDNTDNVIPLDRINPIMYIIEIEE